MHPSTVAGLICWALLAVVAIAILVAVAGAALVLGAALHELGELLAGAAL